MPRFQLRLVPHPHPPEVLTPLSPISPSLSPISKDIADSIQLEPRFTQQQETKDSLTEFQTSNFNSCDVIRTNEDIDSTVRCSLCQTISHVKCVKSTLPSDFDPGVDNGDEIHWCCTDCINAPNGPWEQKM